MKSVKINWAGLAEFKLTLPEDVRNEQFRWLTSFYNVPMAYFMAKELELPLNDLNVAQWCKAFGMDGERTTGALDFNLLTGVNDNEAMSPNVDTQKPILVVQHTFGRGKNKGRTTIIIDGNKRLRKAFLNKQEIIKGYFFPADLAKKFRT